MSLKSKIKSLFRSEEEKKGFMDEIVIEIPEALYIKELALYSAISLIANAVSQCEILVYENGKQVRDDSWYSLNVKPNVNESASQFWHKVVEVMLRADEGKGALVFIQAGNMYCADEYEIKEKRPFKLTGNLYDGVVVDDLSLNRTFTARDTMIFKLENRQANILVDGMYADLSGLIKAAMSKYKSNNIQRWKFKVDAREAGDEKFQKEWQEKLKKSIKKFVEGENKVYVEFSDRTLDPIQIAGSAGAVGADAGENISLINEVFELVSKAYHIPPGLITAGNYNVSDLVSQFLTFVVDPIADMISKTLTAAYGRQGFNNGIYFRVDTSKIKHFDIFDMASNVDKLISSGFASVNEVRRAADWDAAGDPDDPDNWLNKHILTKNYLVGGKEIEEAKNV